jgi:hypothetical protein
MARTLSRDAAGKAGGEDNDLLATRRQGSHDDPRQRSVEGGSSDVAVRLGPNGLPAPATRRRAASWVPRS